MLASYLDGDRAVYPQHQDIREQHEADHMECYLDRGGGREEIVQHGQVLRVM
jgi:hypothetical protein